MCLPALSTVIYTFQFNQLIDNLKYPTQVGQTLELSKQTLKDYLIEYVI